MSKELFHTKECPICKREFIYNEMSIYKIITRTGITRWYCRYKCWRKAGGGGKPPNVEIQKQLLGIKEKRKNAKRIY